MKKTIISISLVLALFAAVAFAQDNDIEYNLDVNAPTAVLPKIFKPNIDLSGRGFSKQNDWPQNLSSPEVINTWQKEMGFSGLYRLQFNLWEINECAKDKATQEKLLANYEDVIKKVNDAGGVVILDIFGTPSGLGKVLDKKSPPIDFRAFKELVKGYIRELSCDKKYNIWYEVWSAPDVDDFFLGRKQDYLAMYRAVAEGIKELKEETKINIPLGGPGTSWWFQNCESNTVVTPEKSLIYDLISYCYHYHLPLDFISWHAYSTDPKAELGLTRYNKTGIALMRDWLTYFNFERDTPLLIDEWNYDSGANYLTARGEQANIGASFILSRLKNMSDAGLDYQLYFSLEDFHKNKEFIERNVGIFIFDSESPENKVSFKSLYNIFRMLKSLGRNIVILPAIDDEFVGAISGKQDEDVTILFYNYIDPAIAKNYLSRNIATLNEAERKVLLNLVRTEEFEKIISGQKDISALKTTKRLKALLKKAQELSNQADKFKNTNRNIKVNLKNLKEGYSYQRFVVDASCALNCKFSALEEKEIQATGLDQESFVLAPYSVQMIVLKKKAKDETPVSS